MIDELGKAKRQPALKFSTDDVQPRERLAVWREVLGRVHLHLDVEQVGDGPLHATVESHRLAHTSLYFSQTTPVRASRTREFLQDGDHDFRLLLATGAGYNFKSGSHEVYIPDGAAAVLFNGVASSVEYSGSCQVTAVRVRRADLSAAVRYLDDTPARPIRADSQALRLLTKYVAFLRQVGPDADPLLADRVATHLTDLVALTLGATDDAEHEAQGRGLRAARMIAIKGDISAQLSNPDFTIDALALKHAISPRYVRQLFEYEGTSFSEFIVQQRLTKAYRMLSDLRELTRSISGIAYECGFSDLSYFNRTFKKRFGGTPSDIRNRVLTDRR